jgi:hypothetical protein
VQSEQDANKEKKILKKIATVMAVLLVLTIGVTVGLTAAVVYFAKDTDVKDDGVMRVKGTDQAVRTSSGDYEINPKGGLKVPGTDDEDPNLIGTAALMKELTLAEALTSLQPKFSGCPMTHEFKQCYEVVVAKALSSIKVVTLPGVDDFSEGMTVFHVASARLENATVKVGIAHRASSSEWTLKSRFFVCPCCPLCAHDLRAL